MNSTTRYNPNHEGAFNYEPRQRFNEITEDDRQAAQERFDDLIRDSREKIGATIYE
jgi:hypothetical protein